MFPGIKPRTISVPARDVTLEAPLSLGETDGEVLETRRVAEEKLRKLQNGTIFLFPFRQLRYLVWRGFHRIKTEVAASAWIHMQITGYNRTWKLSKESGWSLDDGRAIDRVVKHSRAI